MKIRNEIKLNVSLVESAFRLILIMPAGMIGIAAAVWTGNLLLMILPFYLLVTGLTYFCPVKYLYTTIVRSITVSHYRHRLPSKV